MPKKAKKAKAANKSAKTAKKKTAKKTAKKSVQSKIASKKVSKKKSIKKAAKKKIAAKKKPAKKIAAEKPVKKVEAKKAGRKKVLSTALPVSTGSVRTTGAAQAVRVPLPVETKIKDEPVKAVKTKKEETIFDEESTENDEMNFQYEIPDTFIKPRSKFPQPKPFIPKKEDKRARYSEKELTEFKKIILEKLDEAKKDYELLKATLTHKDEHGTDDTSPTFKLLEDGSDVLSKEETAQLAGRQEKFIQNLQNALMRIENKTYGICRATGKLIPKERLRSVPHATLSIGAKLEGTYQ